MHAICSLHKMVFHPSNVYAHACYSIGIVPKSPTTKSWTAISGGPVWPFDWHKTLVYIVNRLDCLKA